MKYKTKFIMSICFILSLSPMLLSQYGGGRGVQEISGLTNLLNPIGILSVVLFFLGVWLPVKNRKISDTVGFLGCLGIVAAEIYEFLTWHILTVSGKFSLDLSFRFAYPEFYIGLAVSICMTILYIVIVLRSRKTGFREE